MCEYNLHVKKMAFIKFVYDFKMYFGWLKNLLQSAYIFKIQPKL